MARFTAERALVNYRARNALIIILVILVTACEAVFVSGQGGTGRETPKSTVPPKKITTQKAPARTITRSAPEPAKPRHTAPQIEMVLIPEGTFTMGSPDSEVGRNKDEGPQRRVNVRSFYLGKYEVTQVQYLAVMGTNPSKVKGDHLPVESVSWNDAVEFCRKLSQMTGKEYRLPSEAEWEYACRARTGKAGSTPRLAPRTETPFAFGSSLSSDQANFDGNYPYGGAPKGVYRGKITPVGSFQPNAFGLYDMHGNVWEWCEDWYHDNYNGAPTDGSAWLSSSEQRYPMRVKRGGSFYDDAADLRSAKRPSRAGELRSAIGFRVVAVR